MNIRKVTFNIVDRIQGGLINNQIRDIAYKMGSDSDTYPKDKDIRDFLSHARNTTKFYSQYESPNLSEFPIINKKKLKENYNDFLSNRYNEKELIKTTTSGSYGTPFTYHLTKQKKKRQQAEVIYFAKSANYDVGTKHAYVRVANNKSKIKLFMQNELLINPTNMTKSWFDYYRNKLKKDYKVIIGYTSTIYALAKYCSQKGDGPEDFFVKGVITSAEPLLEEQKRIIEDVFGSTVVNRYSTEEFGVLASSCKDGNLHINRSTFLIELLQKDSEVRVDPGEVGRIVVTDLYSHALPLIRYDIGDLGIMQKKCTCGYNGEVLTSVLGRQVETIFDTSNNDVSPFALNRAMTDIEGVLQFQFIQDDKGLYRFLIVPLDNYNNMIEEEIIRRFSLILGKNADITIEKVKEIPALNSGKRPYIIQNYIKPF